MSLDTTIFQILKAIDWSYENNDFIYSETLNLEKLNISNQRLELLIEELVDKNYIKGLSVSRSISGHVHISKSKPRLTLDGLNFLEDNTSMKNAYKVLKEVKGWIPGLS